jgi:hypothetical protein
MTKTSKTPKKKTPKRIVCTARDVRGTKKARKKRGTS